MGVAESRLKGADRAANTQKRDQGPVCYLEPRVAHETVVDEGDVSSPHQKDDSLEVQFQPHREHLGAVGCEDVEAGHS